MGQRRLNDQDRTEQIRVQFVPDHVLQASGRISDRFSPAFILSTISAVCMAWVPNNWYAHQLDPEAAANAPLYRDAIVRLVRMMIKP